MSEKKPCVMCDGTGDDRPRSMTELTILKQASDYHKRWDEYTRAADEMLTMFRFLIDNASSDEPQMWSDCDKAIERFVKARRAR